MKTKQLLKTRKQSETKQYPKTSPGNKVKQKFSEDKEAIKSKTKPSLETK